MIELDVEDLLYHALERVVPYFNVLPPSAAAQIQVAMRARELKVARRAPQVPIVQRPGVPQQLVQAEARDPDQVGEPR